ncbi:MAG: DUF3179 domain-containing (seleno)protein [Gammaproteobacteria bacterium]|nr:DUF3179 domain-containing (seleno)protein [Gammaproteobacteria bacterium]HJP35834.1 DUF3179 domain-containing (seleno)protein [Gammaproteobacteria bacterium]
MTDTVFDTSLVWEASHWTGLAIGTAAAFVYFRDLGDVTQALFGVKRHNMMFAIRHEYRLIGAAVLGTVVAGAALALADAGIPSVYLTLAALNLVLIAFPYTWLHWGLRNQQNSAVFYSVDEARKYVRDGESVIVLENNGEARAHPDNHIKRPHLAGNPEGLGGENVIITYCCMTHLGHGFKPEIDNQPLDLEVIAQHGNNLIMRDKATGEPIQQVYGSRECDGRWGPKMQEWPTFRMPFRAFAKAYPDGKVFLNKYTPVTKNPVLWLWDHIVEIMFLLVVVPHHHSEDLLFNTMDIEDKRLRRKELVWGFNVGQDSVAYTEQFIRDNGNVINANVGDQNIVASYDSDFESVGIWYNDSGEPVHRVDFWGDSDRGKLDRVETVKAGLYWFVWVNYFPETELNRLGRIADKQAA